MKKSAFTLAEVEICPPRGPILHEIKISAKGGAVRSEAETRGSEDNANESASVSEQLIRVKQISKQAFTLAEVLITLAIIGVVAALTIPSVISNSQQQEFKTGLRKAVSVLNSAITTSMALDGETPYDNADLMGYLMKHMAVIESTTDIKGKFYFYAPNGTGWANQAFYTTDGMRFEFRDAHFDPELPLYEDPNVHVCAIKPTACGGCGSFGLNNNHDNTTKPPCLIMVDVNGDRKPNPANINCKDDTCAYQNKMKFADPLGVKLTDLFSIMITDKQAIPYGIAAQKAMYQAQK